jgi:hypothetical protein
MWVPEQAEVGSGVDVQSVHRSVMRYAPKLREPRLGRANCDDMRQLHVMKDRVDAQQSVDLGSVRAAADWFT